MSRLDQIEPPSTRTVGIVVGASILVTLFHFADNWVSIETYPQPDWITGPIVVVSWFLFTAVGVAGYLLYRGGNRMAGALALFLYSYTGISSLGHFASGGPEEFTTRGLISVFVDGIAGTAVLVVAVWAILAQLRRPSAAT